LACCINVPLNKYYPDDKIRKNEMGGTLARMGRVLYGVLVEKPEGRRLLFRPTSRCKNNIKIDLIYIYWNDVDWIYFAQGRSRWRDFVNTVMNLQDR
jgi:hypothetical protein